MGFNFRKAEILDLDGFRLAYHRGGQGEPMLLIHGIITYSFIWRNLMPSLEEQNDVIAIDLLGCGQSDKPVGVDYSISAQADLIKKFMQKLGIDRFYCITHDIGGGIGQILATRYPESVKKLFMINTIAYDFWPVQPILAMRIPIIRQLAMAAMEFGIFRVLVARGMYHKDRVTDDLMELYWEPMKTREGRQGFLQLAKCLDNRQLMDIADDLRKLKIPVMIVRGDADPYLGPELAEKLHKEIPGSRLQHIETGGHFIMEDEPEQLVGLIKDFISS